MRAEPLPVTQSIGTSAGTRPARQSAVPQALEPRLWAVLTICWRQRLRRSTRFQFWRQLASALRAQRVCTTYLSNCALIEHFIQYRQIVRDEVEAQLAEIFAGGKP